MSQKGRVSHKDRKGFSIVELMVSLLLTAVLMVGVYKVLVGQSQNTKKMVQRSTILRQIHQSRQVLTERIRYAGYNVYERAVLVATPTRLKIWSDDDPSGLDEYIDEGEAIEFRFVEDTLYQVPVPPNPDDKPSAFESDWDAIFPSDEAEENWAPLVRGIKDLQFRYIIADREHPLSSPADKKLKQIREIEVEIELHEGGLTSEEATQKIEDGELDGRYQVGTTAKEIFSIRIVNRDAIGDR